MINLGKLFFFTVGVALAKNRTGRSRDWRQRRCRRDCFSPSLV